MEVRGLGAPSPFNLGRERPAAALISSRSGPEEHRLPMQDQSQLQQRFCIHKHSCCERCSPRAPGLAAPLILLLHLLLHLPARRNHRPVSLGASRWVQTREASRSCSRRYSIPGAPSEPDAAALERRSKEQPNTQLLCKAWPENERSGLRRTNTHPSSTVKIAPTLCPLPARLWSKDERQR